MSLYLFHCASSHLYYYPLPQNMHNDNADGEQQQLFNRTGPRLVLLGPADRAAEAPHILDHAVPDSVHIAVQDHRRVGVLAGGRARARSAYTLAKLLTSACSLSAQDVQARTGLWTKGAGLTGGTMVTLSPSSRCGGAAESKLKTVCSAESDATDKPG